MKVLVINCGSSSLKYQLIDSDTEAVIAKGLCERIGIDGKLTHQTMGKDKYTVDAAMPDHNAAVKFVLDALLDTDKGAIASLSEIDAVGHRIVHGGEKFANSVVITDEVMAAIEECNDLAPLHNPANLIGIRACQAHMPGVPMVAVFDTAFHQTMPDKAYTYAIPYEYYENYKIRRYGFHGTSHSFVSKETIKFADLDPKTAKVIVCHLGNGASISASIGGKCVDTSMGLTPLDGEIMGTRTGSIDPSAVLYIMKKEGKTPDEMSNLLNKKSGILGVSGLSSDDRDVKVAAAEGNKRAKLARDMQIYEIKKYIGSYTAAMDGVDAIVFTGGIGENADDMRATVCDGLTFLGIKIDKEFNKTLVKGKEGEISTPDSKVRVFVLPTNEELVIARDTKEIVTNLKK